MIRVLLAEDHRLVRAGLERLLATADDIEVVGGAADGAEAVTLAAETSPDVVLMDLSMPNLDGIEATRAILGENEGVQIVVLDVPLRPRSHPRRARRRRRRLPAERLRARGADRRASVLRPGASRRSTRKRLAPCSAPAPHASAPS